MITKAGVLGMAAALLVGSWAGEQAVAQNVVLQKNGITTITAGKAPASAGAAAGVDYVNARPRPLPTVPAGWESTSRMKLVDALSTPAAAATPGVSPGWPGSGATSPVFLGAPAASGGGGVTPQEHGTGLHPFTTARADMGAFNTSAIYPNRAAGKLFFNIGADSYICSASLIKRGIIVTAAHCVAEFGLSQFFTGFSFVPAYRNGVAPFGTWGWASVSIKTVYYDGTDTCAEPGIVCSNDVAIIVLQPSDTGAYPGTSTGWYGFGYDGYGATSGGLTQVTQLGYPACLDNGGLMERNDSFGYKSAADADNTIIGSLMCGGSSGGPWLVSFGTRPTLTGTSAGAYPTANVVTNVTSWGYTSNAVKQMGASPFLSSNIKSLVDGACAATPAAC